VQTSQFIHIPCAADVPKEPQYADQRYFTGLAGRNRDVYASGKHIAQLSATKVDVYRHGPDDCAMLTIQVENHHGKSETTANLKPAELRDLARRQPDTARHRRGGGMSQNIWKSPKAKVLAVAPKAKCEKDWARGGNYTIHFFQEVNGFNGDTITQYHTGTANPADAWAAAVWELRLDGFNRPHAAIAAATEKVAAC